MEFKLFGGGFFLLYVSFQILAMWQHFAKGDNGAKRIDSATMLPDIRGLMTSSSARCLKPLTMVCMLHWILILYILNETAVSVINQYQCVEIQSRTAVCDNILIGSAVERTREKNHSNRKFYNGKFSLQNKDRWSKSESACLEGKKIWTALGSLSRSWYVIKIQIFYFWLHRNLG